VSALCLAGGAAAKTEEAPPPSKWERDLQQLSEAIDRRDCDNIIKLAPSIADAPPGSGMPDPARPMALMVVALCEHQKGEKDSAYAHIVRATGFENSPDLVWEFRFAIEVEGEKHEAAVATIEAMSRGRGAALNAMPTNTLWTLDTALRKAGQKALRLRLLAVLAGDGYDPDEMFVPPDGFRLSYARMLIESGDRERARALALGLKDPSAIAKASLDLALRGFFPADVDVRAAAERELAAHREAMARYPDRIQPIWETSQNLRQLGRAQEALELLRAAERKLDDEGAFTDLKDHLSWFWDNMARTYRMLGRYDDALAAYAKGGAESEGGNLNVSQLLNMAGNQISLGRYEDALRTIAVFDDPKRTRSPYGEMVLRWVRGCAHGFSGRAGQAAADVAYAKAHAKDNPGAYAELLLCAGIWTAPRRPISSCSTIPRIESKS
jgi:tetratricopeptide (TPR) repeat protein